MVTTTEPTNWFGYLMGLVSSATFGLIPLLSVPLLSSGIPVSTVLMYRFLIATLLVGGVTIARGESLRISLRSFLILLALSVSYFFSSLLLLEGYRYMPTGVATVIHFSYPTFVVLLLFLLFRQRIQFLQGLAVLLSLGGVSLISGAFESEVTAISAQALIIVLLSGFCYATYIIILNHSGIEPMSSVKLTTYVLGLSAVLFAIYGGAMGQLSVLEGTQWLYVFLLALIPTVCSNLTFVWAVQRIGSTPSAIMGALEPLTAVIVGALALGEELSAGQELGIVIVLIAVLLLVLSPFISHCLKRVWSLIVDR